MNPAEGDAAEAHLVNLAQAGDERSFEMLFDRYFPMIHAFAYRSCLAEADADDIAQETFIRAARSLHAFRAEASFKNWLFRIAHHVTIDRGRRMSRREQREAEWMDQSKLKGRTADFTAVHLAVNQLPIKWRETLALVFFEEMTHAEAAKALDCAETTISWRIFRAKRVLGEILRRGAS